jgi:hypothetical protein
MLNKTLYAVITGDLVGSSKFEIDEREAIVSILKGIFHQIPSWYFRAPFKIFRGDSFQGVLENPEDALTISVFIRAGLLSKYGSSRHRLDARLSIGVGTVDYLSRDNPGEGDGAAFRSSGLGLDAMNEDRRRLSFSTPWKCVDDELSVECSLLDAIINRWTPEQAEIVQLRTNFPGKPDHQAVQNKRSLVTQREIASKLGISQSAVVQRLDNAGHRAVDDFIQRYGVLIKENIINHQI